MKTIILNNFKNLFTAFSSLHVEPKAPTEWSNDPAVDDGLNVITAGLLATNDDGWDSLLYYENPSIENQRIIRPYRDYECTSLSIIPDFYTSTLSVDNTLPWCNTHYSTGVTGVLTSSNMLLNTGFAYKHAFKLHLNSYGLQCLLIGNTTEPVTEKTTTFEQCWFPDVMKLSSADTTCSLANNTTSDITFNYIATALPLLKYESDNYTCICDFVFLTITSLDAPMTLEKGHSFLTHFDLSFSIAS